MISRLGVLLRRAKDIFQTEGLTPLLKRGFDFATAPLYQYGDYYLYQHTLEERNEADFMPRIQDFTFKIICTNREADELAASTGYDFRRRFVNARKSLDKGAIAFCTFVKGEIVNICWVALSEEAKKTLDPLLQKVDFSNNEAYISGSETIPEYRNKGLSRHSFSRRVQFLREKGVTSMRGAVRVDHRAPQTMGPRRGAEIYATARYIRILWWKFWKETPLAQAGPGD
jgi:GNAT superfamily N-acetyltransferase